MDSLYKAIDDIIDAYNIELPEFYKRRDKEEPNRIAKEKAEDQFYKVVRRRFRTQAKQLEKQMTLTLPHKSIDDWLRRLLPAFIDPKTSKELLILFTAMITDGIEFFAMNHRVQVDWTAAKLEALDYVDKYHQDWIASIDDTTKKALERELNNFVKEEGYTMGDIMAGLKKTGMDDARALRIATTEVTRTYGQAELASAEALAKEYPDAKVMKTWFTNRDDIVCPICRPLDGISVEWDKPFSGEIMRPEAHVNCRCWMTSDVEL